MGGITLGKAVLSSGLLDSLDSFIIPLLDGMSTWLVVVVFGCMSIIPAASSADLSFAVAVLVISTLVSHTIAAVLLVPVAAQIGSSMGTPHPRLLIFVRLTCFNKVQAS